MKNRLAFSTSMLMHGIGLATALWLLTQQWRAVHGGADPSTGFLLWIGAPFLICAVAAVGLRQSSGAVWVLAAASLVNWFIAGGSVYYEHLVMRPTSQGAFLFVALPVLELVATFIGTVLASIVAFTKAQTVSSGA